METFNHKGFVVEIYQCQETDSPNDWGNEDCFIVYDHRNFCVERKGFDPQDIFDHIEQTKRWFYSGYWVFPLYAYIHSGVALSLGRNSYPFTCHWDTSFRGFALVKRTKGWSYTNEKAVQIAQSLIEEWNNYLSGNVWGYSWECGACGGYYGNPDEYMIDEVKAEIDAYIIDENRKRLEQHAASVKIWAKNRVPLQYRKPLSLIP